MTPQADDVMHELQRLRAEIADIRRRLGPPSSRRVAGRARAAMGFLAGALGTAALSAFVPTVGAQGTTLSGCIVPTNRNYLRVSATCAPGEFKVSLVTGDASKDPKVTPPNKLATRIVAPFEVVDEKGVVIMKVTKSDMHRGVQVFNAGGQEVAVMNAIATGSIVKVFKPGSDNHAVTIGATEDVTGFLLRDGSPTPRVSISAVEGAGIGLRVYNAAGKLTAAIGHISDGAGRVYVHDATGKQRAYIDGTRGTIAVNNLMGTAVAALGVQNDKGVVQVENEKGPLAVLTQSQGGNGIFHLYDAGGTSMVEAGTNAKGAGFVGTGPGSQRMLPGIPGSYITGKR